MRIARTTWLTALLALALLPAAAAAQDVVRERVRVALLETDRRVSLAEEVAGSSGDRQALDALAGARDQQGRARQALRAGRPGLAARLTLLARESAERAIQLGRGLPTRERLRGQWDRTREMLERAGPAVRECGDARASELLRMAVEMQERARIADEAGRPLAALQLTMGARERCLRALRLCGLSGERGPGPRGPGRGRGGR